MSFSTISLKISSNSGCENRSLNKSVVDTMKVSNDWSFYDVSFNLAMSAIDVDVSVCTMGINIQFGKLTDSGFSHFQ